MTSSKSHDSDPRVLTLKSSEPLFRVDVGWDNCSKKHVPWLARAAKGEPIYRLPKPVITELASAGVLDKRAKEAECDLQRLCDRARVIGFIDGMGIVYNLLLPPAPPFPRALMQSEGWSPALMVESEKLAREADRRLSRLRGVAG